MRPLTGRGRTHWQGRSRPLTAWRRSGSVFQKQQSQSGGRKQKRPGADTYNARHCPGRDVGRGAGHQAGRNQKHLRVNPASVRPVAAPRPRFPRPAGWSAPRLAEGRSFARCLHRSDKRRPANQPRFAIFRPRRPERMPAHDQPRLHNRPSRRNAQARPLNLPPARSHRRRANCSPPRGPSSGSSYPGKARPALRPRPGRRREKAPSTPQTRQRSNAAMITP